MDPAYLFEQYADDSADHRNPTDPDVAVVLHEIQKWVEVIHLTEQNRLS